MHDRKAVPANTRTEPGQARRPATSVVEQEADGLLRLQRAAGNAAVLHLVRHGVQRRGGEPGGEAEQGPQQDAAQEAEELAGEVTERDTTTEVVNLDYAFFFTGGGYGNSARRFFEVHYPEHRRVSAASFEALFDRLHRDVRAIEASGRRAHVDEIVLVTHANSAGGLQIPLARDDVQRQRNFTPWDLAELQHEFTDRTHRAWRRRQRFRQRRQQVVAAAIDDGTRVVVRGCRFGQSEDGLGALRAFFGGEPIVFAPTGYQGYEVARIGASHLGDPEEAFDMLQDQGMIPADLELSPEEKRTYIARELGTRGAIPSEFFITTREQHERFGQHADEGSALGEDAEGLKTREGVDIPSAGEQWGASTPTDSDPELDGLSLDEIERRARLLHDHYRPEYAPMLRRLRDAWERHPESLARALEDDTGDPLAGLPPPELFGDSNLLAIDAARFEDQPAPDVFETTELDFPTPDELEVAAAGEYEEGVGVDDEPAGGDAGMSPEEAREATEARERARQFDKRRPPLPEPPPEPELPDLSTLIGDEADLALLREILGTLPDDGWKLSDTFSAIDLGITAASAPTVFMEATAAVFLWELAGLSALIFTAAGLVASISEAAEAQEAGGKALGVRLGLEQLAGDAAAGRAPLVPRWEQATANSQDVYYQVALGYPLSAEDTRANIRHGMRVVANAAREARRAAEAQLRQALQQAGYGDEQVDRAVLEARPKLRALVFAGIVRTGWQMVRQREAALRRAQR